MIAPSLSHKNPTSFWKTPLLILKSWLIFLSLALLPTSQAETEEWQELKNCQFLPNEYHDGDSFKIKHQNKILALRIYFIDAPESNKEGNKERSEAQSQAFLTTPEITRQVGDEASKFTSELLQKRPFRVYTKETPALGRTYSKRVYAFIQTEYGDLGEILLSNGYGRLHGYKNPPPHYAGTQKEYESYLKSLENQAKNRKKGIWKYYNTRKNP